MFHWGVLTGQHGGRVVTGLRCRHQSAQILPDQAAPDDPGGRWTSRGGWGRRHTWPLRTEKWHNRRYTPTRGARLALRWQALCRTLLGLGHSRSRGDLLGGPEAGPLLLDSRVVATAWRR
ncbi:hypothetical protein NDU88_006182 [Pleurodeles waltl]|uniref:Uncharacterized protein n=1 Tax=Pleurodeles waltl TaxID=8319 RepID=A0AAV7N2Q1_PLEWA|nr:hypothetical protein NDU88_006182 [Pleurodeles waltl]